MNDCREKGNSELLFFILIFLLLFYDNRFLTHTLHVPLGYETDCDSTILFFILIFLLLFY